MYLCTEKIYHTYLCIHVQRKLGAEFESDCLFLPHFFQCNMSPVSELPLLRQCTHKGSSKLCSILRECWVHTTKSIGRTKDKRCKHVINFMNANSPLTFWETTCSK